MKQVDPIVCSYISIYKDIIRTKYNPSFNTLFLTHIKQIEVRIDSYYNNKSTLQNIAEKNWSADIFELLESLFSSKCKNWNALKVKLKEVSKTGKCLYCDLNEVDSLEHYLPKFKFPEFSVLTLNLLPCCTKCNRYKNENWLDNGTNKRLFINFYFDAIDQMQFLRCNVSYEDNILKPNFIINFESENIFSQTCRNHFSRLKLNERYSRVANETITSTISSIKFMIRNNNNLNNNQIKEFLFIEALSKSRLYGINYWQSALLQGLANNDRFINELFV